MVSSGWVEKGVGNDFYWVQSLFIGKLENGGSCVNC